MLTSITTLVQLLVVGWLPGAAIFRLPFAEREKRAALDATETEWDAAEPAPGVYFHWYEPSYYTGFAPRTQDPQRVHIELATQDVHVLAAGRLRDLAIAAAH